MLKTIGLSDSLLGDDDDKVIGSSRYRNLSKSKKSKNAKSGIQMRIGAIREPTVLTSSTTEAFNQLRQAFTKAPILQHLDSECHIQIETDASSYAIRRILSQLTFDHLTFDLLTSNQGQWYPIAYFLRKMILAKTRYKTHNGELLAIVKAFKTWRHYLEGCKHKVLVLTDYNKLCQFMDMKSLSSIQVRWAQKLSHYHF